MEKESFQRLLSMVQNANKIYNKNDKCEAIHKIVAYGSYIYYTGEISNKEFNEALRDVHNDFIDECYYTERNKCLDELLENNKMLNEFFKEVFLCYSNFNLNIINENINKKIKKEFIDFLKYFNCYDLFCKLKDNNCIAYQSKVIRHSVCIDNRELSYIVIKPSNSFHQYLDLVHEFGHAYENKILSNYRKYFDLSYSSEIISIIFNRIFIEYLFINEAITKEEYLKLLANFELCYYQFVHTSLFITNSIKSGYYKIGDFDISIFCDDDIVNHSFTDYNYAIGRIICFKLFNDWEKNDLDFIKQLPKLIVDINSMDIVGLIKNYGNTNLIKNEFTKTLIKK